MYTYVGDNKQEIMMVHCVEGIHTLSLPVHYDNIGLVWWKVCV